MRVKSAVDWWISAVIWGTIILTVSSISLIPRTQPIAVYVGGVTTALLVGMLAWIDHLYGRSGPLVEIIPYDKIRSVILCENMLSSLALSRKRIEIRQHGKGFIRGTTYISPENREEFMSDLLGRCSNLEAT